MKPLRLDWKGRASLSFGNGIMLFSWHGLPKDVHLTFSCNPQSEYINLHVTRNVKSPTDKPKVTIARIAKTDVDAVLGHLCQVMFEGFFIPFDMRPYQRGTSKETRGACFFSLKQLEKKRGYREARHVLSTAVKQHFSRKRNGKALILEEGIEQALERCAGVPRVQDFLLDNIRQISQRFPAGTDYGVLVTKDLHAFVLRCNNQWFVHCEDANPSDILRQCMTTDIFQALVEQTLLAIDVVSKSSTYAEAEAYDQPITLFMEEVRGGPL